MFYVEIIAVGNELLLGDVLDTNSNYLCCQFTSMGGVVRRVVQIRDEVAAIAQEVREALRREPHLVVTTGGLGPTDDDVTLQGVAEGLDRPLLEHPQALDMMAARYRYLSRAGLLADTEITPSRRKMSSLPQGGTPLYNPVGTAPGVLLHLGNSALICLPGVPDELRSIFEGPLAGPLAEIVGVGCYAEWAVDVDVGESTLAPIIRPVIAAHPDVYIKSRAGQRFQGRLRVTLSRAGDSASEVTSGLQAALDHLQAVLSEAGITVLDVYRESQPPL